MDSATRSTETTSRSYALLTLLSFAMFIVSLDQYIVVVALPDIARDLGYSKLTLQSVISAYTVASAGFVLLGGRASDLLGRRRVLAIGLILYCAGSLGGGLAASAAQQIAARTIQGLGSALVFPSTLALINVHFAEGAARNRALGVWAGAGAAGLVVGVLLGGALTNMFGWRAVFLVNVPLAGLACLAAFALIGPDGRVDRSRAFDLAGALTATASVTAVVVALIKGQSWGWTSVWTVALMLTGVVLGAIFVRVERASREPLLPLSMLSNAWLRLALIVGALFMATFGALLYFLSIFFQDVLRYDALQTGLAFLLPTVVVVAASSLAGRAVTRFGLRNTMILALSVGALGALSLAFTLKIDVTYGALVPGLIAMSIGDGAMFTAIFIAASLGVVDRAQGVASGIVSTGQGVGAAVGLALLVLIADIPTAGADSDPSSHLAALGIAYAGYAIAAGIVLTLIVVVSFSPRTGAGTR